MIGSKEWSHFAPGGADWWWRTNIEGKISIMVGSQWNSGQIWAAGGRLVLLFLIVCAVDLLHWCCFWFLFWSPFLFLFFLRIFVPCRMMLMLVFYPHVPSKSVQLKSWFKKKIHSTQTRQAPPPLSCDTGSCWSFQMAKKQTKNSSNR